MANQEYIDLIQNAKKELETGDLDQSISILKELYAKQQLPGKTLQGIYDKTILLNGRLTKLESENSKGILTHENYSISHNKIIDDLLSCINEFESFFADSNVDSKQNDFNEKIEKYAESLEKQYSSIKIPWKPDPIHLRDVFVNVNILKKLTEQMRLKPEELDEKAQEIWTERAFGETRKRQSGLATVNELQKFVVLGKPGAGKTTFLKKCVLYALDNIFEKECIPVFIGLKQFTDTMKLKGEWSPGGKLLDYIVDQFDIANVEEAKPFITYLLSEGKALILLDGLDEVDEKQKDAVIREIQNLSNKYSKNQFIITCRIAAYNALFQGFDDVEMADFGPKEIKQFINNWFNKEPNTGEVCWKELKEQNTIYELAKTPLLLTMLCIAYDEANHFPRNRSELYSEAIEALLKTWDSKRRIRRSEVYKDLTLNKKEVLFSTIAFLAFRDGNYFLRERWLTEKIGDYIINLPKVKGDKLDINSKAVLHSIIANHGLIVQRADKIYSFSHLTFQEFFTAKFIVDNVADRSLEYLVNNHLRNEKWLEVFLLVSEMLPKADQFLLLIKSEVNKGMKKVLPTLHVISNLQVKKNIYNQPKERLLTFFPMLDLASTRAVDRARAINLGDALSVDSIGDKSPINTRIISISQKIDRLKANVKSLGQVLDDELNIKIFYPNISRTITNHLNDLDLIIENTDDLLPYIENSYWLVRCLNTQCYVTKETRQKILDGILAVPGGE